MSHNGGPEENDKPAIFHHFVGYKKPSTDVFGKIVAHDLFGEIVAHYLDLLFEG